MLKYGICPRCELNYIDLETQEICDVCKKQLLGQHIIGDDLSSEEDNLAEELHSPFQEKTIDTNEQYEEENFDDEDDGDNSTWRGLIDIDDDADIPDFSFDDDESDNESEEDAEEEIEESEEDDFEYVSADDYCADDDDDEEDADDF